MTRRVGVRSLFADSGRRNLIVTAAVAVVIALAVGPAGAGAAPKKSGPKPITVLGSYVSDLVCLPTAGGPTPEVGTFEATCEIGAVYAGGFRGHTAGWLKGTFDLGGSASGTFDETFHGQYVPDGSWGTWRIIGTFSVDGATQVLQGTATINDGTCGFAGSSGTWKFFGTTAQGGYSAEWVRPQTAVSDPACVATNADLT